MDLILWRHAEAVDGSPDHSRALTPKGLRQAERIAAFMASRLPDDTRVLVSPALRAQQTASAFTKKFITEPALNIYASPQAALTAAGWPSRQGTTILVGHQPWLGEVAALLMTGTVDSWSVKKGSIWWFRNHDFQTSLRMVISPDQV